MSGEIETVNLDPNNDGVPDVVIETNAGEGGGGEGSPAAPPQEGTPQWQLTNSELSARLATMEAEAAASRQRTAEQAALVQTLTTTNQDQARLLVTMGETNQQLAAAALKEIPKPPPEPEPKPRESPPPPEPEPLPPSEEKPKPPEPKPDPPKPDPAPPRPKRRSI